MNHAKRFVCFVIPVLSSAFLFRCGGRIREKPGYKVELESKNSFEPEGLIRVQVGQPVGIALEITSTAGIVSSKTLRYTGDLDGIISYGDKPYSPGEIINIGTEEEIPLIFTLTESGEGDLRFTFEDSAGQTRELTLPIEVEKNDITVTVTPTGGSAYDNHAKDIEIEVTPNSNGDVGKYSIKYEVLDGNGVIDQLTFVDGQGGKVPIGKFVPLGQFKRTIRLKSKPYRGANSGLLQR